MVSHTVIVNQQRAIRVADLVADFQNLQYLIAAAPIDPPDPLDYHTEGWAAMRQCRIDGQYILNVAADTRVPQVQGNNHDEQAKAEWQLVHLDAYARRHQAQKIFLRQGATQRWRSYRENLLRGERPHPGIDAQLAGLDVQLRTELASLTDDVIYSDMRSRDYQMGRWTLEDPTINEVLMWLGSRV